MSLSLLKLFAVASLVFLASCARGPRPEDAPALPPPADPAREKWEAAVGDRDFQDYERETTQTYRIGPGDVIAMTLVGRPDILGSADGTAVRFTISENPMIVLPEIGSVTVHGKTPQQLEEELRAAYSRIIRDPQPAVTVEEFSSNMVTVLGTVKAPGRYPLNEKDTILEMIFKAGGLTFGGNSGGLPPAQILKVYRGKLDAEGRLDRGSGREEIIVPLDEFILGGDLSYDMPALPNDVIYIPPAGTVSVVGDAKQPRVVFLGPGLRTVSSVLTEAGGLRYRAHTRIELVRTHPDQSTEIFNLRARDILTRRAQDFVLRDNDQIFIYTNNWRAIIDFIGTIFRASANTGVNATYSPAGV